MDVFRAGLGRMGAKVERKETAQNVRNFLAVHLCFAVALSAREKSIW